MFERELCTLFSSQLLKHKNIDIENTSKFELTKTECDKKKEIVLAIGYTSGEWVAKVFSRTTSVCSSSCFSPPMKVETVTGFSDSLIMMAVSETMMTEEELGVVSKLLLPPLTEDLPLVVVLLPVKCRFNSCTPV